MKNNIVKTGVGIVFLYFFFLIILANLHFYDSKIYEGQTIECLTEHHGSLEETRGKDWLVTLSKKEDKPVLFFKYKDSVNIKRQPTIFQRFDKLEVNIYDGEELLFTASGGNKVREISGILWGTISLEIEDDKFLNLIKENKINNLQVEFTVSFRQPGTDSFQSETYWGIISASKFKKLNFDYLMQRYIEGNKFFIANKE